jgi:hypothetical protein
MTQRLLNIFLVVALAVVSAPLLAENHDGQAEATAEQHEAEGTEHAATADGHAEGEEHAAGHGEEHHFHKNHFAVFIGSTEGVEQHGEEHGGNGHGEVHSEGSSGSSKDDPSFTLGLDYERRFSKLFGFGGMMDWVVEDRREFLLGPIGFLHPFGGAKLFAAPLAERVYDTGDWEFVARVGAAWDFHVGQFSVSPTANYDMGEEHDLWVLGVSIGRGW